MANSHNQTCTIGEKQCVSLSINENACANSKQNLQCTTGSANTPKHNIVKKLEEIVSDCSARNSAKRADIANFTLRALVGEPIFETSKHELDADTCAALDWRKAVSNTNARAFREEQIQEIEQFGKTAWETGKAHEWLARADPCIQHMCRRVNGPLIEKLVDQIMYEDRACAQFFREGAQLAGILPGDSENMSKKKASLTVDVLKTNCKAQNEKMKSQLRLDQHHNYLHDEIRKDAIEGRMMSPRSIETQDLDSLLLSKRFATEQGTKVDGSVKVRAIDDMTDSGVNLCSEGGSKIQCDGIDALVQSIKRLCFHSGGFKKLGLWKADIKSAYRRIPIMPEQRWLAGVVMKTDEGITVSRHNAMMFGAYGSVVAWDRIGKMISNIALKVLRIPNCRWVDDFFGVEPEGTLEHSKQCFARLNWSLCS